MAKNDNQNNKKSITGKIGKVIFLDTKSGRSILSVIQENDRPCCVIGNITGIEKDSCITATGSWKKDEKYGWQFMAEDIQVSSQPEDDMEPVEDGLMHALDFSNVLNKRLKEFRDFVLDYEYDEEKYELGDLNEVLKTIKVSHEKKAEKEKKNKEQEEAKNKVTEEAKNKLPKKKEPNTATTDGAIYNKEMTRLISGPKNQATFTIPSQVTCIVGGAFTGSRLESVVIPDSVRSIRSGAFSDCKQLTEINIASSVSHIGDTVFAGCDNLMSINVDPENPVYRDVDGVLYSHDLSQLLYVPNGLTSVVISELTTTIKQGAFNGCKKITELSIPSSVVTITQREFCSCSQLTSITIPELIASAGISIYFQPSTLTSIQLNDSVQKIDRRLLSGCCNLQSIEISDSVQNIAPKTFYDCSKLKSISVVDNNSYFQSIDGVLYDYDLHSIVWVPRSKTTVNLPNTIKRIADRDFADCKFLKSIVIPESVTSIGNGAFDKCESMTSITIPPSVAYIGRSAFFKCTKLRNVTIFDIAKWCSIEFGQAEQHSFLSRESDYSANPLVYAHQLELDGSIIEDLIIPDIVTAIKDISFFNCKSLEHVTFPSALTQIGQLAFYGCSNLVVNMPDSRTSIGKDAFKGCKKCIIDKTVDIDWKDVEFQDGNVSVPDQLGGRIDIEDDNVDSTMRSMLSHLKKIVPYLTVCYSPDAEPYIVNAKELHDAVITLKIKDDLAALIRDGYQPNEILRRIDGLSQKYLREFIPRDMTPYINFLLDKHATERYPIVPIVEYIGGRREEGALYTIMIDDQPNIVWENNNDARSTYVFPCSEEDYEETRQLVFDYIMAEEIGKRKLLHTDKCTTIFKEKPLRVVHNTLKSWASKIMRVAVSEIDVEDDVATPKAKKTSIAVPISSVLTKDQRKELTKATIHIEYELDPELHFYDDQMWDDDGDPVGLYYAGEKSLSRERDFKVTKRLINEALADCGIESIEDVYELLCEYVAGFLGDDIDEVSEGVEVSIEIEGSIVYTTNIGS